MKVLLLSDIHEYTVEVPDGIDAVFFAGDFAYRNAWDVVGEMAVWTDKIGPWLLGLKKRGIKLIGTGGNHDSLIQVFPQEVEQYFDHFILNRIVEVDGLKIFATPFSLPFWNWAFNLSEENLCELLGSVKQSVDVIISHGPPYGILDSVKSGKPLGSYALLHMIERLNPKLCLFGHIHEGRGYMRRGNTWCVNASNVKFSGKRYVQRDENLMVWDSLTNQITLIGAL